jgi:hypothetical protein
MKAIGQKGFAYENLIGNQSFLEVSQLKGQGRHSKKLNIADSLETDIEFVYQGRRRFLAAITVLQQDLQVQPRHPWVVGVLFIYRLRGRAQPSAEHASQAPVFATSTP